MKILILGGNRFVGKQLSEELFTRNEIDIFNRSGTGISNINIIQGDRNNKSDLEKINFDKYDCIVDMCLYLSTQFNLIKDLIPTSVNYIFVSSVAVYFTEAFGEYGVEKKNIEELLKKTDLNYKIVRPSYIVGKGTHRPRLGYLIDKLKSDEMIPFKKEECYNKINLVFVQDVVKCLWTLVNDMSKNHNPYNVCSDESITINEIIDFLKYELNIETHYTIEDDTESSAFQELAIIPNLDQEIDNLEIKKDYGISFTDVRDGIKEFINEY
jgi:nucleoside-diphosphate-sugar epimerase